MRGAGLMQRAVAPERSRWLDREVGIMGWPGRIWIAPEEGGDLFERSGWAGGENEENVEAAIGLGWN